MKGEQWGVKPEAYYVPFDTQAIPLRAPINAMFISLTHHVTDRFRVQWVIGMMDNQLCAVRFEDLTRFLPRDVETSD